MTLKDLYNLLNAEFTGKVAYNFFPEGAVPELPYICILELESDNFGADNKVYHKRKNVNIELYTEYKDETTESILENLLDSAEIFYESSDTYIEDERMYERIYEIEV